MKWNQRSGRSDNLDDRRRIPGGAVGATAGVGGIGAIIVLLITLLSGGGGGGLDLNDLATGGQPSSAGEPLPPDLDPDADQVDFLSVVLDNNQAFWADAFAAGGGEYGEAKLVLFSGRTQTGCGVGSRETGPFYCSLDDSVYIDLDFFDELLARFGADSDFAQAYVLAHEVGHHVQNEIGVSAFVIEESQNNPNRRNELSIRQELQADCFAGVWANSVDASGDASREDGIEIDRSDIREGLAAAAAVGDDRIQETTTGRINPESWTHGSAEQRVRWFEIGFDTGDPQACDTFSLRESEL